MASALAEVEALTRRAGEYAQLHEVAHVQTRAGTLPIQVVLMGNPDPQAPALGLFGGVHGVERIGTDVVLAYLHTLTETLAWWPALARQLMEMRLVFMPVVNPGGLLSGTRCNPNGVDLMRNAPLEAGQRAAFMVGGHRVTRLLPWYRGRRGEAMQTEAAALCQVVEDHLFGRPFSIALDCHSGFGMTDRIWFPYAHTSEPFAQLAEVQALKEMFSRTYPNHLYYRIEPQALNYRAHGDLWDFLYDRASARRPGVFVPLTLEMGSWLWVRKNPRQLLKFAGMFNPLQPHRHRRILRRHLVLIEFLARAVHGYRAWLPTGPQREALASEAKHVWYGDCE